MKKIIFTCLTIILCVFNVHASGMSFNVTCPQGAAAGSTVSCTVSASSTSNTSLCAMSAKLSISNATFVSFDQKISLYQNTSSGFVYDSSSKCISSKTTIGTLKIKMPNSGSASLTYSNIQASDSTGTIKSTASNVTKTIRVFDNNNNLSNLTVSTGSLSPSFSANTTNYTVNVAGNVSAITIGASASSSKATLSGTGKKNLSYGSNKFTITVKSEAGTTKKYTIQLFFSSFTCKCYHGHSQL